MTLTVKDLVFETSPTTGLAPYVLSGPVSGFQAFSTCGDGALVPYIVTDGAGGFEIGIGTLAVGSTNTLDRTTVMRSSNSDGAVSWGIGVRNIRIAPLAEVMAYKDENLNFVDFAGVDSGTANAHAVTLNGSPVAYSDKMMIVYRVNETNTAAGVTVNVNSLGAKSLKVNGADPAVGLLEAGTLVIAFYKASANAFEAVNYEIMDGSLTLAKFNASVYASQVEAKAGADNTKFMTPLRTEEAIADYQTLNYKAMMRVRETKALGTAGGSAAAGANKRALNTLVVNNIAGASFNAATNRITLPAGTYLVRARAPAFFVNGFRTRLYNVTTAAYIAEGANSISILAGSSGASTDSMIDEAVTLADATDLELHTWAKSANAGVSALGEPLSIASTLEYYSDISIFRL